MSKAINIIIDWKDAQSPIFVEVENDKGASLSIGEDSDYVHGLRKIRITAEDILRHHNTGEGPKTYTIKPLDWREAQLSWAAPTTFGLFYIPKPGGSDMWYLPGEEGCCLGHRVFSVEHAKKRAGQWWQAKMKRVLEEI